MKEFVRSLIVFALLSIATGIIYPLAITGLSQIEFRRAAHGSLVASGGETVGSSLIGQRFVSPRYFHGRPSAIEKPYDASNSGGSNAGPSNAKYIKEILGRAKEVRKMNGLSPETPVPADLILASGSGLDPHISPQAAAIQAQRVARERGIAESEVRRIIARHIEGPQFGCLGEDKINVLSLNMALDELDHGGKGAADSK
jgi:potassium-transporting ATPase KdpC subunit